MKISYSNNFLTIEGNDRKVHQKTFYFPINKVVQIENILVVMIDPPCKTIFNENVYGINAQGEIIWQVPPRDGVYEESSYINVVVKDGKLLLINWDGFEITTDPMTGKEISRRWLK